MAATFNARQKVCKFSSSKVTTAQRRVWPKTWKLWLKFTFTTETVNLAANFQFCWMEHLNQLYDNTSWTSKELDKKSSCYLPPLQAQEAPVERSSTCFWQNAPLCILLASARLQAPIPQRSPNGAWSVEEQSARKVLIKMNSPQRLPSKAHTVTAAEWRPKFFWEECVTLTQLWAKTPASVTAGGWFWFSKVE